MTFCFFLEDFKCSSSFIQSPVHRSDHDDWNISCSRSHHCHDNDGDYDYGGDFDDDGDYGDLYLTQASDGNRTRDDATLHQPLPEIVWIFLGQKI